MSWDFIFDIWLEVYIIDKYGKINLVNNKIKFINKKIDKKCKIKKYNFKIFSTNFNICVYYLKQKLIFLVVVIYIGKNNLRKHNRESNYDQVE